MAEKEKRVADIFGAEDEELRLRDGAALFAEADEYAGIYFCDDTEMEVPAAAPPPLPGRKNKAGSNKKVTKKRKKPEFSFLSKKAAACLLVFCLIFSAALGFGAGWLAFGAENSKFSRKADEMLSQMAVLATTQNGATLDDLARLYDEMLGQIAALTAAQNGTSIETLLSIADIAARCSPSVVEIRVTLSNGESAGSGVIISADGYIVTNNHVVAGANKATVTLNDGKKYNATVIGLDPKSDIAVVKIEASGLKPAVFGDSGKLRVGELAVAIGNSLGELGGTVTNGIISALSRNVIIEGYTMTLLQTNAAVNPGNSGGGLFNDKGELVGIVNAKATGDNVEGLGFAIPISSAKAVIDDLTTYGYVPGRISMGVTLVEVKDAAGASSIGVPAYGNYRGVYIKIMDKNSPASKAGLAVNDRIISVNGVNVASLAEFFTQLDRYAVGDTLTIAVSRSGSTMNFQVTLEQYKGPQN